MIELAVANGMAVADAGGDAKQCIAFVDDVIAVSMLVFAFCIILCNFGFKRRTNSRCRTKFGVFALFDS